MNSLFKKFPVDEKGQSIVIMALLLSFVFLALAAMAVDGTIIYLRRRQLQNIADAAALSAAVALSQSKTEAEAYQKAMDTITSNEGEIEWYSTDPVTPDPPNTNIGTGQDLDLGIEITNNCDVRVALRWSDIGTYFAQFVGRELLEVGARAHAGCNRAGGLMPIAVKRFGDQFDTDDTTPPPDKNDPNTIYCGTVIRCDTRLSLPGQGNGTAYDFLRVEGSDVITNWPGWPSQPEQIFDSPSPHADLASGTPGREYFILGSGVAPNVSTAGVAYSGLVNLDLRDLTGAVASYNGVPPDAQTNTLKDYAAWYIRQGYCCDIPKPGDQAAIISGLSNNFSVQPLQQTYAISDVVAVIVYDGHVYKDPDLDLSGTPDQLVTYPTTTTLASNVLTYTIDLEGDNGFTSSSSGMGMTVEGLEDFADWSFSPTASPILPDILGNNQRTLTLRVTPTVTTVVTTTHVITGARMFYVRVFDNGGTNVRRYWPGIAAFGDGDTGLLRPSVTAQPNKPYISLAKGDPSVQIRLEAKLWGLSSGNYDVTLSAPDNASLPTGFSWRNSSPPWVKNNLGYNQTSDFNIRLEVDNTATAKTTPYAIPLTVSAPGLAGQTFNLYVQVKEANATTKDYVVILGYAALQITDYPNVNSVRGRIVSELMDDPSKLKYGLRARLIPW